MIKTMCLSARRELLRSVGEKYQRASSKEKRKILDGFIAAIEYDRKYSIRLLNDGFSAPQPPVKRVTHQKYDDQVLQALLFVWHTANQICSKRLVPFLPSLVESMERHGHLRLPNDVRKRLQSISAATIDRLLRPEREKVKLSVSTTQAGNLLKHQIKVRTFADWDDVTPGFLEADLVAHCRGNPNGSFLNTLTLVDIAPGWLECMPLLRKSAGDVINGLSVADELLPFSVQGIDTDCGSEFINYELLDYCEDRCITFTRARTYKKNDQAHVEEKNGSVVRRMVGYDRFEGRKAWEALAQFYRVLRMYVNFFQPSLKLLEKTRDGARVTKKYDKAKTPYQRILLSPHIEQPKKDELTATYLGLDPVDLLKQLQQLQDQLWEYSWSKVGHTEKQNVVSRDDIDIPAIETALKKPALSRHYRRKAKKVVLHHWRTRKDPFEHVWDEIRLRLELIPEMSAKETIDWLMTKYPGQHNMGQVRTLQRRFAEWRQEQLGQESRLRALMVEAPSQTETIEVKNLVGYAQ